MLPRWYLRKSPADLRGRGEELGVCVVLLLLAQAAELLQELLLLLGTQLVQQPLGVRLPHRLLLLSYSGLLLLLCGPGQLGP